MIAGEASGDTLGAGLMRALRKQTNGTARFKGIGGPLMLAEGLELLFPHTELMHFGVIEVLRHIPRLARRINQTVRDILQTSPSAVITIDSPDFCFRVSKQVRAKSDKLRQPCPLLIHYVAPTVWAWRPGRARKIARFLDHLLAVLPFEPPFFTREGLACTFVGHSLIESNASKGSGAIFREARGIDPSTPLLTVLPGSRISEITRLLPVFREVVTKLAAKHTGLQIVVPTVPHLKDTVAADVATWGVPADIAESERDKYDAMAASDAALACSGTVALELALARLPAAIAYKVHWLTALLYRRFIRVPYANLVNIMQGKRSVPEFIQENCTALKLFHAVDALLSDPAARQAQVDVLELTAGWLGQGQFVPSERAAATVLGLLSEQHCPTVLQVLPALVTGGVERGTIEMVAAMVKVGFRAVVASSGGPMADEVEAAGGQHITLPLKSKNPFTMWANIGRLRRAIRLYKVDIVHARSRAPAWSAYLAAKREHVLFVTTFHSAYGAETKLKRLYNSVMAKGSRVIAISNFVAAYAEKNYKVAADKMRLIPRGVDVSVFNRNIVEADRIDALRRSWNLPENTPIILMPGRLTRWKGHKVLIDALAKLQRRDWICVLVGGGKGDYAKEIMGDIRGHNLERNILMMDTCRDMPAAYALASMVIVPSTRPEGFGRVVIEAQAMGVPVIASKHGGAAETVIQNETGWLTAPGDAEALASAIEKVLGLRSDQRELVAMRAVAHIRSNFTTSSMTGKTLAVYRELLPTGETP